jgi:ArsR family transcriptional regulator
MDKPVDGMFRAFADVTRLRILHLLARRDLSVCEIMATMGVPQSKISRHLGYLRDSGLVVSRTQGQWRLYSLAEPTTRFQARAIHCLKDCFDEVAVLRQDMARLKVVGPLCAARKKRLADSVRNKRKR